LNSSTHALNAATNSSLEKLCAEVNRPVPLITTFFTVIPLHKPRGMRRCYCCLTSFLAALRSILKTASQYSLTEQLCSKTSAMTPQLAYIRCTILHHCHESTATTRNSLGIEKVTFSGRPSSSSAIRAPHSRSRSITPCTNTSGAEAPAVTPITEF